MAAAIRAPARAHTEREPLAAKAPAANSSESPGRKGVTTSPVSQKTIAKSSRYVQAPYSWMIGLRCLSRCRTKSSSPLRIPMAPRRLRAPRPKKQGGGASRPRPLVRLETVRLLAEVGLDAQVLVDEDRKSTRLNSSHVKIS